MKTKNVLLTGIAVFAISLLLTSPVLASADETLDIYGNANEDDTIDMRDLTYVKLIFFGKKPETELADAKYDGKINPLDFVQIKLIIVGKEKELTLVDGADRIVTVNKPVERIIPVSQTPLEAMRSLKAKDRVVGVTSSITKKTLFFPELSKLPGIGSYSNWDYEKIYELNPDICLGASLWPQQCLDELEQVKIKFIVFSFGDPVAVLNTRKLGYILDKREEAEKYVAWYEGHMNTIKGQVDEISEEDKPRVYCEVYSKYKTTTKRGFYHPFFVVAGGINIAADLPGKTSITVDPEWVVEQNPDIIVRHTTTSTTACGYGVDDPAEMKALRDSIMNRPELATIDAVENERVFVISVFTLLTPVAGTAYLAKWYYPEMFSDLDPQAIQQEYLTFQGLDYDLDEHGVFVYPPLE